MTKPQEPKSNRGGKRPGAGRPKVEVKKESCIIRVTPAEKALIEKRRAKGKGKK